MTGQELKTSAEKARALGVYESRYYFFQPDHNGLAAGCFLTLALVGKVEDYTLARTMFFNSELDQFDFFAKELGITKEQATAISELHCAGRGSELATFLETI